MTDFLNDGWAVVLLFVMAGALGAGFLWALCEVSDFLDR